METHDNIVDALRATAMLCRLSSEFLGTTRTDTGASRDMNKQKAASLDAGRVVVKRLAGADVLDRAIRNNFVGMTRELQAMTMPFGDDKGWRILPTRNFDKAITILARGKKQHDALVQQVRDNASTIIEQARTQLGEYDIAPPTEQELIEGYNIRSDFRPIPEAKFQGLPQSTQDKLAQRLNRQIEEAYDRAKHDVLRRFIEPLSKLVERINAYDKREATQTKSREGVLYDTVITNITAIYDMLEAFNVDGDERLIELGNMLASIARTEPDDLRENRAVRDAARQRAEDTLARLDDWLNPMQKAAQ